MTGKRVVASEVMPLVKSRAGKTALGGNSKADQAWIEAVQGELLEPDLSVKPEGFLYDVHYMWDGYADEINPDFFEPFRRGVDFRCTGTAYVRDAAGMYIVDLDWQQIKRPCLNPPMRGTTVCQAHGGKVPVVVAAAKRRLAEASEVVALRLIGLTGSTDADNNFIDHKDRISAANSVLDRAGIKGGMEVEITGTGFERVLGELFGAEQAE